MRRLAMALTCAIVLTLALFLAIYGPGVLLLVVLAGTLGGRDGLHDLLALPVATVGIPLGVALLVAGLAPPYHRR